MADIEPLPGLQWNAHAALHDALNRADIHNPIVIMWLGKDGIVRHSSSATRQEVLWMLEYKKHSVLHEE